MVPVFVICDWDPLSFSKSSKLDTKVPEKSQGSFQYVKQDSTMREILKQWCDEEYTLTERDYYVSRGYLSLPIFAYRLSSFVDSLIFVKVWKGGLDQFFDWVECVEESCTDLATVCQESITTIQNFLSFTREVLEAANMSNIGAWLVEKLLTVLRFTGDLKHQLEQSTKQMSDNCLSFRDDGCEEETV